MDISEETDCAEKDDDVSEEVKPVQKQNKQTEKLHIQWILRDISEMESAIENVGSRSQLPKQ